MPPPPISEHIELPTGVSLAYDQWGTGDDVVLFLHGGGQTRHSWGAAAERLAAQGRRTIAVDLRGHGGSDWSSEGGYELDVFARDIAAFVDALAIRPHVVGASLGGLTAMVVEGAIAPGSIRSLVLVDIVPNMNVDGADRVKAFMSERAYEGFGSLEEVAEAIAAYNPHRPPPTDLAGLEKNLRRRDGRWYWHWDPAFIDAAQDHAGQREVRDVDRLDTICGAIEVPMALVRGRLSDLVTESDAAVFRARHPEVVHIDVSGAGHMVAGDRNDIFTAAVADFLASLA